MEAIRKGNELQGKFTSAKSNLTKALAALEKTSLGFDRLTQEEELLTKQRYARNFLKASKKVESKKANLETCYNLLIEHVHSMASTCQESIADTDGKLQEQEKLIKQAKHVLSLPLQLKAVIPGPAQAGSSGAPSAALPVSRAQTDLLSTPIEKNSIIPKTKKLAELATAKKAKKKKEKKERQKKLKEEKKKLKKKQ